jgi:hypothetical protein
MQVSLVELTHTTLVALMSLCPALVIFTVGVATKPLPARLVMTHPSVFGPFDGVTAVTVTAIIHT